MNMTMQITQQILAHVPHDVFSTQEIMDLLDTTDAARYNQVKRAIRKNDLIQIRRELFSMGPLFRRHALNPYPIAGQIYGPSYVSVESALAYHHLIPESVPTISSVSIKRARTFQTPIGVFQYSPIPASAFLEGVERIVEGDTPFLMATPLKALVDYVYTRRMVWDNEAPIAESLRIDTAALLFSKSDLNALKATYPSQRVRTFLSGIAHLAQR